MILTNRPHTAVATDIPGEPGLRQLLLALAELAVAGVPLDPTRLFHGRDTQPVTVSAVPRRPGWLINGHLITTADGHHLPGGLRPAHQLTTPHPEPKTNTTDRQDTAVLEFLRNTRELIAAQREVMLGYLATPTPAPTALPTAALPPTPVPTTITDQTPESDPATPITPAELTPETVLTTARSLISERTGYPVDMLGADLDLEADLSIDSIKRTELIGLLTDQLGLAHTSSTIDDSIMEELTRQRTLRAIVTWITNRTSTPPPATPAPVTPPPRAQRYLVQTTTLPPLATPPDTPLTGRRITIIGDGVGIALELSVLLERRGAAVRLLGPEQSNTEQSNTEQSNTGRSSQVGGTDALIYLAALDRCRAAVLPEGFTVLRDAVLGGVSQLLVITGSGGHFGRSPHANGVAGIGLPGLVRTIAHEFPDRLIRIIDIDPKEEPTHLATHLLTELLTPHAPTTVGYSAGQRLTPRLTPTPLNPHAPNKLTLGPDSVVLLTGGARGITAHIALGLAHAGTGHLELIGRTPAPTGDEDPVTATATDRIALRRLLAQTSNHTPTEIEAATNRILAEREIRTTLTALAATNTSTRYHTIDVRNPTALTTLMNHIYQHHQRLDGIIHGAGILADQLLINKTPETFAQVWATKVTGAQNLTEAARTDLRFLILFGSVSGVFGNPGQTDYAAANDALDTLAHLWNPQTHTRILTLDWGPWTTPNNETGMVTTQLTHHYTQRGIGLINPHDGITCLLTELTTGTDPQVIYMRAHPTAFEARPFEVGQDG